MRPLVDKMFDMQFLILVESSSYGHEICIQSVLPVFLAL